VAVYYGAPEINAAITYVSLATMAFAALLGARNP
jgi:hypothetical protein